MIAGQHCAAPSPFGPRRTCHQSAAPIRLAVRSSTTRNQPIAVSMYLRVWYQSDDVGMRIREKIKIKSEPDIAESYDWPLSSGHPS